MIVRRSRRRALWFGDGVAPGIDHQAKRQSLPHRPRRRLDAVDRAEHAPCLKGVGQQLAFAGVALELKLHQPEQRDRHGRVTFHIHADGAHVPGDDRSEASGSALILPREPCRQGDGSPLRSTFRGVGALRRCWFSPNVLHVGPQGLRSDARLLSSVEPRAFVRSDVIGL